jgi:hypothetical protein
VLIEDYFQKIESDIANCPYIFESRIHRDKRSQRIGIISGEISFKDESILYFIEFINVKDKTERYKYSYHYQDRHGNLIFRYDMAPHHREIETFPHHKHVNSIRVTKASVPDIAKVLDEIVDLIE